MYNFHHYAIEEIEQVIFQRGIKCSEKIYGKSPIWCLVEDMRTLESFGHVPLIFGLDH